MPTVMFAAEQVDAEKQKKLLKSLSGVERMDILEALTKHYHSSNSELALSYGSQFLQLAKINKLPYKEALGYTLLASIHKFQIEYDKCLIYNKKALKIYQTLGDSSLMAIRFYYISDNLIFLHQIDSAIYYNSLGTQYYLHKGNKLRVLYAKIQLGKALCFKDENEKATILFNEAIDLSIQLDTLDYNGWALYWLGFTNMKLGNFKEAKSNFLESIEIYNQSDNPFSKIGSQQELGELSLKTGDYANAYKLFFSAYKKIDYVKGDRGSKNYHSQYFINMGNIYYNIHDLNQSKAFYDSAKQVAKNYQLEGKLVLLNKLYGNIHFEKKEYQKALEKYRKSLSHFQLSKNQYILCDLFSKIGDVYLAQDSIKQAISNYKNALKINEKIVNKFGCAQNHVNLAFCFKQLGQLSQFKKQLDLGIKYAELIGVDNLTLRYYKYYVEYCLLLNQHQESHKYLNKYIPLAEKTNAETQQNLASLLLELYENELNKENELHENASRFSKIKTKHDQLRIRLLILGLSLIIVLLFLIAYFLISRIRMTKKLELLVNERTRALQENEKKILETSQTKDRFYSIIAHDLKSPFNSLIGFSNLLHDDYDDFSDEDRKKFILIIRNSSEEIFALLENLLDWARKNSDKLIFKPVKIDLYQIIKQTLHLQEKNAGLKKISITNLTSKNTFVIADENMLKTVLRNLTSNAIKFTNSGGNIIVNSTTNNGAIACSITDNGIGMTKKVLDNLFSDKGDSKKKGTANERGTGLGLLLCKDFIERMGGELSVESIPDEGSTFTFSLPAK